MLTKLFFAALDNNEVETHQSHSGSWANSSMHVSRGRTDIDGGNESTEILELDDGRGTISCLNNNPMVTVINSSPDLD
jgi:hypothetical protein